MSLVQAMLDKRKQCLEHALEFEAKGNGVAAGEKRAVAQAMTELLARHAKIEHEGGDAPTLQDARSH